MATATRLAILETALDLFVRQGYEKTPLSEVSDRLGVTKAALYYHFKSKESILVELVSPYLEEMDDLINKTSNGHSPASSDELLGAYLDLLLKHREIARLLDRDISALSHPDVEKRVNGQSRRLRRLLAGAQGGRPATVRAEAALGALRRPALQLGGVVSRDVRKLLVRAASAAANSK
ncbi:MAG TPA: helix-turn-helix domain-containing protein [Actinomycetota bacterium]|nr:helix-turn-helix domain-containing protein [Actinomycetota bacterium]